MCVIIHLPPGKKIPEEKLWNAVCNNWHGWGLGLWDEKKKTIDIIRSVPDKSWYDDRDLEAGGNHTEFDKIVEALINNEDKHRYLHLRHATRGRINMDNCHPIPLYVTPKRQVYAMHNGSFHFGLGDGGHVTSRFMQVGYGNPNHSNTAEGTGMSDTVDFCRQFLMEPLKEFVKGDYTDPVFIRHIWVPLWTKYGNSSKFLIFSNDMEPLKAGSWDDFKNSSGEIQYHASNNMYFDRISRGPIFQENERAKTKAESDRKANEETKKETSTTGAGSSEIKMISYEPGMFQPDPVVQKGLANILEMYGDGVYADTIANLRMCSVPEFESMIHSVVKEGKIGALAFLFDHIVTEFGEQQDSIDPIITKKEASEKMTAKLKAERDKLQLELDSLKKSYTDDISRLTSKVA